MNTPTPGAASELLPFSQIEAVLSQECLQAASNAIELDVGKLIYRRLMMRLRTLAAQAHQDTPSPVTEGAQREAVACSVATVEAGMRGLRKWWHTVYGNRPRNARALVIAVLQAASEVAPPPPDRVHPHNADRLVPPERAEAVAWLKYRDYNGTRPTSVHVCNPDDDGAFAVYKAAPPTDEPERVEACVHVHKWADGADGGQYCVSCHAKREPLPAPPTDASGGVTEERIEIAAAAIYELLPFVEKNGQPAQGTKPAWHEHGNSLKQDEARAYAKAALEAADRARKPGYRQVTLDELTALVKEAMQDGWNDICMDSGHHPSDIKQCGRKELEFRAGQWASNTASFLMRYFTRENIGAVVPDTAQGASGQQAQPE